MALGFALYYVLTYVGRHFHDLKLPKVIPRKSSVSIPPSVPIKLCTEQVTAAVHMSLETPRKPYGYSLPSLDLVEVRGIEPRSTMRSIQISSHACPVYLTDKAQPATPCQFCALSFGCSPNATLYNLVTVLTLASLL